MYMKKKQQTDFSTAAEIIQMLGYTLNEDYEKKIACLFNQWSKVAGENIAKYSTPYELTEDGVMKIRCKNSVVANEIFNIRYKINEKYKNIAKKNKIDYFKYIKITYNR